MPLGKGNPGQVMETQGDRSDPNSANNRQKDGEKQRPERRTRARIIIIRPARFTRLLHRLRPTFQYDFTGCRIKGRPLRPAERRPKRCQRRQERYRDQGPESAENGGAVGTCPFHPLYRPYMMHHSVHSLVIYKIGKDAAENQPGFRPASVDRNESFH